MCGWLFVGFGCSLWVVGCAWFVVGCRSLVVVRCSLFVVVCLPIEVCGRLLSVVCWL